MLAICDGFVRFADQYTDLERSELFWDALAIINKNFTWGDASLSALLAIEESQKRLDIFEHAEVTG